MQLKQQLPYLTFIIAKIKLSISPRLLTLFGSDLNFKFHSRLWRLHFPLLALLTLDSCYFSRLQQQLCYNTKCSQSF